MLVSWAFNQTRSAAWSNMRLLNMYPEAAVKDTSKDPLVLLQRPGEKPFATVGSGPMRGVHTMDGIPFIVSGTEVYTFGSGGNSVLVGTVPGTDRVDMADNGFEVAIVAENRGFIATTTSVTEITDPDFRTPSSVTFQDTYFIFTEVNTGLMFRSEPLDGLSYNGLDFATAENDSDDLKRVFADSDELWAMGLDTLEFWYNDGSSAFSFTPTQGKVYETGCLARDTVEKIDNSLMWLGSDKRGGRIIWRGGGGAPIRISTHAIEKKMDEATNPEDAYAFTFTIEGHAFYIITFPDFVTFAYSASTGMWVEWQTWEQEDWNPIGFTNAFNKRLVGDRRSNKVYELDLNTFNDDGVKFAKEGISRPLSTEDQSLAAHNFFRLDVDAGTGNDAVVYLSWADEDGTDFNNPKSRTMGATGKTRQRVFWRRLGVSRSRVYKFRCTEDIKFVVKGAYLGAAKGIWK